MAVKKTIRPLIYLLLFIFSFQLLPLLSFSSEAVTFPMEKTKALVLPYTTHGNAEIRIKDDREPPLKLVTPKLYKIYSLQTFYFTYFLPSFKQKGFIIDHRHILRGSILMSFHGSKYKCMASL